MGKKMHFTTAALESGRKGEREWIYSMKLLPILARRAL
jgi:hypothetical protein